VCLLWQADALTWAENRSSDWRARATADPLRANRDIVIIDIDNASYRALTDKLGRWPWTRRVWTELVRYLTPGQPRLILFDVLFSGTEPAADPEFASVLRAAGNVILPFSFVSGHVDTQANIFTPPEMARVAVDGISPGEGLRRDAWSLNQPNTELAEAMAGSGVTLWTPDSDGMTRRLPLVIGYEGKAWATVWLAAALKVRPAQAASFARGRFTAGTLHLPLDDQGRFVVRWHGDTLQTYRRVPLWEMICSIYPAQCDAGTTRHAASEFAGKIVFVGASAAGSYEVRPTPVSETAPGMFVLATALDNLLEGRAIRVSPGWLTVVAIALMSAIGGGAVMRWRAMWAVVGTVAVVSAIYAGLCFYT